MSQPKHNIIKYRDIGLDPLKNISSNFTTSIGYPDLLEKKDNLEPKKTFKNFLSTTVRTIEWFGCLELKGVQVF